MYTQCRTHLIGTTCVCASCHMPHGVCVISALAHNLRRVQSKAANSQSVCVCACVCVCVCVCVCCQSWSQSQSQSHRAH